MWSNYRIQGHSAQHMQISKEKEQTSDLLSIINQLTRYYKNNTHQSSNIPFFLKA